MNLVILIIRVMLLKTVLLLPFYGRSSRGVRVYMRMAVNETATSHSYKAYLHKIRNTMIKHPEIFCIIAALVFSLCTKYSHRYLKESSHQRVLLAPQPHPRRFFPSTSPVLDFPYGNLGAVADLLQHEEVIFVMYYAPWCAKSMRIRVEFERAATYLQDKVTFVGVNCWYIHGHCRQENSFTSYPVLIAYHTTLDGHRYTGVLEADYMVVFLQRILLPLTYLRSKEEVGNFIAEKDHAVIGIFDFHVSPQPPGYDQFYYASMRVLEKEPRNPIHFGVITSPLLGLEFNIQGPRRLLLTQPFNDTLRYDEGANFTSSAITDWVIQNVDESKKSTKWLLLSGVKSRTLSLEVQSSPTLIVFTASSPLFPTNHQYGVVRELALAYHNCQNSTKIRNTIQSNIYLRWSATVEHVELVDKCQNLKELYPEDNQDARQDPMANILTCCSSVVPFGTPTASNSCDVCMHYSPIHPLSRQHCPLMVVPELPWHSLLHSLSTCLELRASYNPSEHISMCCQQGQRPPYSTSSHGNTHNRNDLPRPYPFAKHQSSTDPYINKSAHRLLREQCRGLRLQRAYGWLPAISIPGLANLGGWKDFTGLGCQTNKSINFVVMNTKLSGMFAEKLGFETSPADTTVVYIDEEMVHLDRQEREAQFVMEEEFTKGHLLSFIKNVSAGTQPRSLRSHETLHAECADGHSQHCTIELSTLTYEEVVMDSEKDVIVYYYAPWCGFCASFSHVYLTLSRYFRSSPNIVFTRIDANENDLPWEFTVDVYPTIHFFPANRKEDSVSFPHHLRMTLPNLIQFVLRFAMPDLRLMTGLSICSRSCIRNNQISTAARIQELHSHAQRLHKRAKVIGERLENLKHELRRLGDKSAESSYQASILILQEYVYSLRRKVRRRQLEYRSARYLHQALITSKGVFIDKHKLSGLLRNHHQLKVAIGDLEQSDIQEEIKSDEDISRESGDTLEKASTQDSDSVPVKDEL